MKLGEVLDIITERGDFGLDGFERHYIFLTCLIFKFLKKYIVTMVTISHIIKTNLLFSNVNKLRFIDEAKWVSRSIVRAATSTAI
jgi:hypothetical protein